MPGKTQTVRAEPLDGHEEHLPNCLADSVEVFSLTSVADTAELGLPKRWEEETLDFGACYGSTCTSRLHPSPCTSPLPSLSSAVGNQNAVRSNHGSLVCGNLSGSQRSQLSQRPVSKKRGASRK